MIVSRYILSSLHLSLHLFLCLLLSIWISGKVLICITSSDHLLLLLRDAFRPLRSVGGVTERFTLLDLLVEDKWILDVRVLLLIEWSHTELLVDESLMFAARRTIAIMGIIAVSWFIQVS